MRRDFKADDYLHLADTLAGRTAGRGRPRTAYLRRATSTAYYALFHELVQHGARRAARNGPVEHQQAIGRWYAHGNFKKADLHQFDMFCLLALGGDRMIRNS